MDATPTEGEGIAIPKFQVLDFVDEPNIQNTEHIRIFNNDLTTPISCVYEHEDANKIDLYIKIPLLTSNSIHDIYLCWNDATNQLSNEGVPTVYRTYEYGKIFDLLADDFAEQTVWSDSRVNSRTVVMSNFDITIPNEGNYFYNKADTNTPYVDEQEFFDLEIIDPIDFIPVVDQQAVSTHSLFLDVDDSYLDYEPPSLVDGTINDKGFLCGVVEWLPSFSWDWNVKKTMFTIETYGDINEDTMKFLLEKDEDSNKIKYYVSDADENYIEFDDLDESVNEGATRKRFYVLSWDNSSSTNKCSLHIVSKTGGYGSQEVEIPENLSIGGKIFARFKLGYTSGGAITNSKYDRVRLDYGTYLDATNEGDQDIVKNMVNYMPEFDNMIGYKYSDAVSPNNNQISFSETNTIKYKERKTMLKWSNINSFSFPDLNFKLLREPILSIIPAPSFLQFEYRNTFLIFTRNTINRFVLSGTADGWAGSVSSLIEEKTQYGLLAPKSLVRAGESIFWLSESGVMMWNKDGMKLISKNIVNVPIENGAVGFYNSLRNQYLIKSVVISDDGNGDEDGDGPESAVWNFGSEIIITQYSNIWIQADSGGNEGVNEGPGVMFQIVGYENLLPEGVSDLTFVWPYSHANSLINIINQPLPQDLHLNVWDYWLLDGVPVGGDGSSIPQEYRWIADPSPEFPHAPVLSFAYPDMNLLLYEESLPEVTFTPGTGETNLENIIYNPYFMGDLEWLQIFGVPRDNVYVLGFWNLSMANVLGATLAGHRTTATRTRDIGDFYSYQIDRNIWTKFNNMNAVDTAILTGGNELSNVNLLLNDNNEVLKYPGTSTVSEGKMKTKKMYFEKGVIRRVNLDHLTEDGNTVALKTTMERYNSEGEIMFSDNTITNIKPRKWRGIPLGKNRGRSITFEIENADNIGSIGFDLRVEQ